ncbi:Box C/D snoRNA accumulation [Coemansia guatemalensis]|uniref:Box C/D snoRNA protein 1 n=1 Tax=Coemansia guatemalensis TaxID=2761395 RepID=A0A9W8HVK4_9FUNG|nr:Box C/D snoRNA accumulation [Coemansia guatemalensis]
MAETDLTPSSAASVCEQCDKVSAKYKCPGCMVRTCSLTCSKAHKAKTGCSGQRDRIGFVKRGDYDANTMMSDYGLLQDFTRDHSLLLREAEKQGIDIKECKGKACQARSGNSNKANGPSGTSLNRAQRNVIARAKEERQVVIRYMSPGIKRHEQNKTIWMSSKSRLMWTIEVAVPEIEDVQSKWIESGFHDVCRLCDLWTRLLDCQSNSGESCAKEDGNTDSQRKRAKVDALRIMIPSDDGNEYPFRSSIRPELLRALSREFGITPPAELVWLIRVQDMPANKPTFCRIDPLQPLFTQLRYQTILEFPTIYVYRQAPSTWGKHAITIQDAATVDNVEQQVTSAPDTDNTLAT